MRTDKENSISHMLSMAIHLFNKAEVAYGMYGADPDYTRAYRYLLEAADEWDVAADALEEIGRPQGAWLARRLAEKARAPGFQGGWVADHLIYMDASGNVKRLGYV